MKNYSFLLPIYTLIFLITLVNCVPTRNLKKANSKISMLQQDSSLTHSNLDKCYLNVKNLQNEKKGLQNDKAGLQDEKIGLLNDNTGLQNANAGLQNDNINIQNDLNNLSTTSTMTIADQAKRLKNLQDLIQNQKNALNKLKQSLSDALINFRPDEISVNIKDGNVYVSLQEKLLFKSGSADIDPKGKQALNKLAGVLINTKDITVIIEGHTDTIPIKNAKYADNWELSAARALSIVHIVANEYGFDPHRIIGSERGEMHPIKSNSTPEGRTSNRRTEIIISPNLTELFKLINQ